MDFSFSEEQEAVRDLAAQIVGERATHERLKEFEAATELVDRATWAELAKANLLGIALPADDGGSGPRVPRGVPPARANRPHRGAAPGLAHAW